MKRSSRNFEKFVTSAAYDIEAALLRKGHLGVKHALAVALLKAIIVSGGQWPGSAKPQLKKE